MLTRTEKNNSILIRSNKRSSKIIKVRFKENRLIYICLLDILLNIASRFHKYFISLQKPPSEKRVILNIWSVRLCLQVFWAFQSYFSFTFWGSRLFLAWYFWSSASLSLSLGSSSTRSEWVSNWATGTGTMNRATRKKMWKKIRDPRNY